MNCPRCTGTALLLSSRDGVEIDYCPQCRGVWLDRGELDKIIERAENQFRVVQAQAVATPRGYPEREPYFDDDDDDDRRGHGKKRKRKGFFSEIFEFGD